MATRLLFTRDSPRWPPIDSAVVDVVGTLDKCDGFYDLVDDMGRSSGLILLSIVVPGLALWIEPDRMLVIIAFLDLDGSGEFQLS